MGGRALVMSMLSREWLLNACAKEGSELTDMVDGNSCKPALIKFSLETPFFYF